MCFAWISEQTAIISLYSINLPVFKTESESVYCAVRNGSLTQTDTVSYLKGGISTSPRKVFHLDRNNRNFMLTADFPKNAKTNFEDT